MLSEFLDEMRNKGSNITPIARLFIPLLLIIALASCGKSGKESSGQTEDAPDVWIIPADATPDEAKEILTENRYPFESLDTAINGRKISLFRGDKYIVEYLGHEWNDYILAFVDDRLAGVILNSHERALHDYELKQLLGNLDDLYGEHRESHEDRDNVFMGKPVKWEWATEDADVDLTVASAVKQNDIAILNIYTMDKGELESIFNLSGL